MSKGILTYLPMEVVYLVMINITMGEQCETRTLAIVCANCSSGKILIVLISGHRLLKIETVSIY